MQAVIPYFGAKWSYADWITSHFPPTDCYNVFVDVFGGSAAIIANAPQVELLVYNDLDKELGNLFRVLRDDDEGFVKSVYYTPYSLDEMQATWDVEAREALIQTDPVEAARRFYVRCTQTFGGYKGGGPRGWARGTKQSNGHITAFNNLRKLWEFADLCKTWQIENDTYANILQRYSGPETLFYLDPPYLTDVCAPGRDRTYRYDLRSPEEHTALLRTMLDTEGYFVISGYDSDLYNDMLTGWGKELRDGYTNLRSVDPDTGEIVYETVDRVEAIWLSPNAVKARNRPMQVGLFAMELA